MLPNCRKFSRESPGHKEENEMSKEELDVKNARLQH